mgnify:CR=1 FL=1
MRKLIIVLGLATTLGIFLTDARNNFTCQNRSFPGSQGKSSYYNQSADTTWYKGELEKSTKAGKSTTVKKSSSYKTESDTMYHKDMNKDNRDLHKKSTKSHEGILESGSPGVKGSSNYKLQSDTSSNRNKKINQSGKDLENMMNKDYHDNIDYDEDIDLNENPR